MIEYKLKIDLQGDRNLYTDIVFSTGDSRGYALDFSFYSYGEKVDLSNYALTIKAKRADGKVIIDRGETENVRGYYVVADNMYAVPGEVTLEIALVGAEGSLVTSCVLIATVREGFGEAVLDSKNVTPIIVKTLAAAKQAELLVKEVKETVANVQETLETTLAEKVDKVEGKGLSANDYTDEEKSKVITAYETSEVNKDNLSYLEGTYVGHEGRISTLETSVDTLNTTMNNAYSELNGLWNDIERKVDKVEGKGLSTNDYSNEEKTKVSDTHNRVFGLGGIDTIWEEVGGLNSKFYGLASDLSEKVDKVEGKGLSTNDYTDEEKALVNGNVLKGEASGNIVSLYDISSVAHNVKTSVYSSNCIPYPHYSTTLSSKGITFTDNGDGTVTANGTANGTEAGAAYYFCVSNSKPIPFKAGTYTISGAPEGSAYNKYCLAVGWQRTLGGDRKVEYVFSNGKTVKWSHDGYIDVAVVVYGGTSVENLVFKPKIEPGTKATEYTPYVSNVNMATLYAGGLNLYDDSTRTVGKNITTGGVIIDATGTTSTPYAAALSDYIVVPPSTNITINFCNSWAFYDEDMNLIEAVPKSATIQRTITTPDNARYMRFSYNTVKNDTTVNKAYGQDVMCVIGDTLPDSYCPFTASLSLYTPAIDGTVEGVKNAPLYMSFATDIKGVDVSVTYNRDATKTISDLMMVIQNLTNAIISLGGNV